MATTARNPLSMRPHSQHHAIALSPYQGTVAPRRASGSGKRARSPEPAKDEGTSQSTKRLKALAAPQPPAPIAREDPREEARREKERKRAEREEEFRIKYTRAFPNWTFHFDLDTMSPDVASLKDNLERRVRHMGAVSSPTSPISTAYECSLRCTCIEGRGFLLQRHHTSHHLRCRGLRERELHQTLHLCNSESSAQPH